MRFRAPALRRLARPSSAALLSVSHVFLPSALHPPSLPRPAARAHQARLLGPKCAPFELPDLGEEALAVLGVTPSDNKRSRGIFAGLGSNGAIGRMIASATGRQYDETYLNEDRWELQVRAHPLALALCARARTFVHAPSCRPSSCFGLARSSVCSREAFGNVSSAPSANSASLPLPQPPAARPNGRCAWPRRA